MTVAVFLGVIPHMSAIPDHIQKVLDASIRRGMVISVLGMAISYIGQAFTSWPPVVLGCAMLLWGIYTAIRTLLRAAREHKSAVARDAWARGAPERARIAEKSALRAEQARLDREQERIAQAAQEVDRALELNTGEETQLTTRLGSIRVQRCVTGQLRLWWRFDSLVCKPAIEIAKSRAKYVGDHPVGWFVRHRSYEASLLRDLASL